MPRVITINEERQVPPVILGTEIAKLPAIRREMLPGDSPYFVDPATGQATVVVPDGSYSLPEGAAVGVAPESISGGDGH